MVSPPPGVTSLFAQELFKSCSSCLGQQHTFLSSGVVSLQSLAKILVRSCCPCTPSPRNLSCRLGRCSWQNQKNELDGFLGWLGSVSAFRLLAPPGEFFFSFGSAAAFGALFCFAAAGFFEPAAAPDFVAVVLPLAGGRVVAVAVEPVLLAVPRGVVLVGMAAMSAAGRPLLLSIWFELGMVGM